VENNRKKKLNEIASNIRQFGHHIYTVQQGNLPQYSYTIGLKKKFGFELILAGGIYFFVDQIGQIINEIVTQLRTNSSGLNGHFFVKGCGCFSLVQAHPTWTNKLLLGAFDFYSSRDILTFQIVPEEKFNTIDTPNISVPWSPEIELGWRWLGNKWDLPVPEKSNAATNLAALLGEPISEGMRWDDDYWELYAGPGPEVTEKERRIVPLTVLFAVDSSLEAFVHLKVGEGLWRESESSEWQLW
jgi:hypothetical protein